MTSELRSAMEVWWKADTAFGAACLGNGDRGDYAAAAVIEADREAVRAELVQEIAEWLRKGEKPFSDCDCAAHLLETGEWKL